MEAPRGRSIAERERTPHLDTHGTPPGRLQTVIPQSSGPHPPQRLKRGRPANGGGWRIVHRRQTQARQADWHGSPAKPGWAHPRRN